MQYICTVCGYTVKEEELDDDFVCPVCGVGKDAFEEDVTETEL